VIDVLVHLANWSPMLPRVSLAYELDPAQGAYFTTRVPGIGGASIQFLSWLSTWRAWIPGSCHNIVKH